MLPMMKKNKKRKKNNKTKVAVEGVFARREMTWDRKKEEEDTVVDQIKKVKNILLRVQ